MQIALAFIFLLDLTISGDFPNVHLYRKMLSEIKDISVFKKLDKNMVYEMDKVNTNTTSVVVCY